MKKLYILYIVCSFSFLAQAQLQEQDFNATTLPSGWSVDDSQSNCSWKFGYADNLPFINPNTPTKFASGSVIFDDNKCGSFKNNYLSLEAPEIDLVEKKVVSAEIELTYNHQAFVESGVFMVDVWDGITWQNVLTVENDSPAKGSNQIATTSNIDVSEYINSEFKVRFVYHDENSKTFGVAIDHYKLIDKYESLTEQLSDGELVHFPNPVDDFLNILSNKEIKALDIYNVLGQKVYKTEPGSLNQKIEMSHLASGTYIVNVLVGNKTSTFKILKQ